MTIRIGLFCLCLWTLTAKAQYNPFHVPKNLPNRDSLKTIIQTTKDPIQKLDALRELGHAYYENKRDSALYFFEQSVATAKQINSKLWEADAFNSLGFVSYILGNYPRALQFLNQAKTIAEDPNSEKGEWRNNPSGFVSPHVARLSILARSYQHLATLYSYTRSASDSGSAELSLDLYRKAMAISASIADTTMMGIINMNTSRQFSLGNDLDSVIFYNKKALELMNAAGYKRYIGNLMYILGQAYSKHQQPETAKTYFWYGIEQGKNIENTRSAADNSLALANLLLSQGNIDSAIYYGYKAADLYRSTLILGGLADSYASLSASFNAKNKIDSAFHYQGLSLSTRKELDAEDKSRRFQQLTFDEQLKAQEAAEQERLARNRIIISILLSGLAVLAAIGIFLYRNNIARKKANQLLAEKNRELEIESSLDRVRTKAMAMQRSEDLAELSMEVVKQVQVLGVPTWFCAFNIHDDDPRGSLEWGSNAEATFPKYRTPREGIFLRYYEAWIKGEKLLVNEIGEDECPAHYEYLCSLPGVGEQLLKMKDAGIPFPTYQIDHVAYFKYGYILFITYEPVPQTHEIFKRFAKVFEQSYTRFLDLQKAEAQTREAQIEAALERVRSRSLAMHHTNELQDVVNVAAQQLLHMNIDIDGGMFIAINDEVKDDLPFWAAAGAADYVQEVTVPFLDKPAYTGLLNAIKRRRHFYTESYSKEDKDEFLQHMFKFPPWNQNSEERKQELLARKGGLTRSVSIGRYTSIGITNHHGKIFSDEDNEVLKRFGAVLEQSYIRFLDLQKAEAQAREAQIQLALERVRARTMAMHASNALPEVATLLMEQVKQLGVETYSSGFNIWDEKHNNLVSWMSNPTGALNPPFEMPIHTYEQHEAIYDAWKNKEVFLENDLTGTVLDKHYQFLRSFPLLDAAFSQSEQLGIKTPQRQVHNIAYFSKGYLLFITLNPCPQFHDLFIRFAKVFDQTFTRFLDLQKAEAQAREAQIELGLERVRARAMAMQTSKELSQLVDTVFKELTKLDFALNWCIINIIDESTMSNTVWAANPNMDLPPESYHMLFEDYPFHHAMLKGWRERRTKDVYILEGEEKKVYDEYLFNETEFRRVPPEAQAASRAMEKYVVSFTFSNFGGLQTVGEVPLSDANIDILSRFGKVFDLTYTRFNDLQKAEAQAREAKIEAALEKVRSRTMAMQRSDELPDAANVLFLQVQSLGIPAWSCGYNILAPDKRSSTCIMSSEGEIQVPFVLPLTEHWSLLPWYEAIQSGLEFFVYEQGGEDLIEHYRYLGTVPGLEDVFKQFDDAGISLPTHQINHLVKFTNGFLLFITYEPVPEAHELFKRFGKVFEQTYTRFLDLQKAEAQAREAQIEASLERVRSRSMAMHNTSELQAVIDTVHKELTNLNIAINGGSFITINADIDTTLRLWGSGGTANTSSEVQLPFYDKPFCMNLINRIKAGPGFFTEEYTQDEKKEFFNFLFYYEPWSKLDPKQKEETLLSPGGYTRSVCVSRYTSIFIINHFGNKFSDADNDILKRFAKVFEQTYTRFLDLQKAEAQAREAQIEAALERVRSRSLAMRSTKELGEVVTVIVEKLADLGVVMDKNGVVLCTYFNNSKDVMHWIAAPDSSMAGNYLLPYFDHPIFNDAWRSKENGDGYFSKAYSVEEKNSFFEYAFEHSDYKYFPDEFKQWIFQNDKHILSFAWQKNSAILIPSHTGVLPTEADKAILIRFSKVFEQAYTRFLDLQKAEAQAREAEIQLALERVRARTMAMQRSEELPETAELLFQQFQGLGEEMMQMTIAIVNEEERVFEFSITDGSGSGVAVNRSFKLSIDQPPLIDTMYNAWKEQKKSLVVDLSGQRLIDWISYRNKVSGIEVTSQDAVGRRVINCGFFSKGAIAYSTPLPRPPEVIQMLERFADAFDLTYTRFLDLKKAEAQVREAKIEAALEKVRSRTMSMQRSDELAETAAVMFRQLITLGIAPNRLYIIIIKDENGDMESWITDEDGSKVSIGFTGNLHNNRTLHKMYEGWKNKQKSLVIDMQGEELQEYFHHLNIDLHVPFKGGLEQKRRVQHISYFSKGLIGIASPEPQPAETLQLLERFAAVFNLTFTRFNDLKIAEAHALQAEQDLIAIKEAKKKAEQALAELKQTQAQLIQAEKMASLGELTAGIAHEIQNPLNFVNNFSEINAELAEEIEEAMKKGDMAEIKELIENIKSNQQKISEHGKRADSIVKGMLQHSRSSSGVKEPTDLNKLADEYLRLAYHGFRAKDKSFNATIHTDLDPTVGMIPIMPQELGRVLLNFFNNAFYAVNEQSKKSIAGYEPTIQVVTKRSKQGVKISVTDNGTGIPEKIKDKIFQPFFTTKPTGEGTGLGLSLSYDIVKAHGGELKAETKEGAGTSFVINLPSTSI